MALMLAVSRLITDFVELNLARRRFDEARPIAERAGVLGRDPRSGLESAAAELEAIGGDTLAAAMREFLEDH